MKALLNIITLSVLLFACSNGNDKADAYGNFESEEVVVSAKVAGELMEFSIEEGMELEKDVAVGLIDTTDLHLQRLEIMANIGMIRSQYQNITAQIDVLLSERKNLEREIERSRKLLKSNAATSQQLDDLEGKLQVVNSRVASIEAQHPNVTGQLNVALAKLEQVNEMCDKAVLTNPIKGTVLNKISRQHELVGPGAPLYVITDLSVLEVKAYMSGDQLTEVVLGQEVMVKVDGGKDELISFPGKVKWISEEAEFTPKIIQTREERVDMVYAFKVDVANDGRLKLGMPAEVYFNTSIDAEN